LKLSQVKFSLPFAHPVTGQSMNAKDHFIAGPEVSLETVEAFVRVTIEGISRLCPAARVLWAEELQEVAVAPAPKSKKASNA
jgi:hypothetical protein